MAGINHVEMRGIAKLVRHHPAKDGKKALAFGSIKPRSDGPWFTVKAFEKAAEDFANSDGLMITVKGHLGFEKPKEQGGAWPMIIIVEKVIELPSEEQPF